MKAIILTLAVVGAAVAAPVGAQVPSRGIPTTSTSRNTSIDGSWRVVGQDRSGTIYERRTYDANGNIVVQRARRDANGNFRILDTRTVQTNGSRNDCQVGTNTVGDIVFGRTGTNNCQYNGSSNRRAADGVWRQVGQGRNNNSIYQRRTIDANGNVVVQRGRRNPNGTFTILSTRTVNNNGRASGSRNVNNGSWNRGHGDNDDDDNSQWDSRRGNDDNRSGNSEHKGHGRGKGEKGRD